MTTKTNKATAAAHGKTIGRPRGSRNSNGVYAARADAYCEDLRKLCLRLWSIERTLKTRRVPYRGLLETRAMALAMHANDLVQLVRALPVVRPVRRG